MRSNIWNPPGPPTTGTYAGNDSADRAIPHGLGRIPQLVIISVDVLNTQWLLIGASQRILYPGVANTAIGTANDSTNFRVGEAGSYTNTANAVGATYRWVAI